jgi:CelD/BcsL family acetyltransferase involved in cellulose biosynthesis
MPSVTITQLSDLADLRLPGEAWGALLARGDTDTVFLTRSWQAVWWETFGRGRLLLLAAEEGGRVAAVAPLFCEAGMVFFTGSGGSDYLDFIGDIGEPAVLEALLAAARDATEGFVGFRFYHVPEHSRTGERLRAAAPRLGLVCHDEGDLAAPALDLAGDPHAARSGVGKKSLVRHERALARDGRLEVRHLREPDAIRPLLPAFFEQHIARWAATPYPSLFLDPLQRRFYERLVDEAPAGGWLRFTSVTWNEQPVAFHFGTCYRRVYLWYKPSFDIALARRSPGEVLLRHLLLAAIDEGARTFDFGLGDEPFKRRFATHVPRVRTWGLYPPEVGKPDAGRASEA